MIQFSDLDLSKKYSYAEYLTWQFEKRLELIKGKIYEMTPAPRRRHQDISNAIEKVFFEYFQSDPCKVYHAPFDVRFPGKDGKTDTVVQPDICVICELDKLDEFGCVGAPDLIVEIISETTARKDYRDKYDLYESEGVKEYWIADPDGFIDLFVLNDKNYTLKQKYLKGDTLESTVFPELSFNLDTVFPLEP